MLEQLAALEPITTYRGTERPLPELRPLVTHPDVLKAAYDRIRSKPGNMTPASDGRTLDGISGEYFQNLSWELGSGSFSFRPSRRVEIPKPRGGRRPLTIAPPPDKIVQEALRMVLEPLFDPTFSRHSHGFRPGRSCHTALQEIRLTFKGISWFLEVDLEDCFGSIDHQRLMEYLRLRGITDHTVVSLLWKALRSEVVDLTGCLRTLETGAPQGSVLSPLLANIFLHQVDEWLEDRAESYQRGARRAPNLEYRRRQETITRLAGARAKARAWAELRKTKLRPRLPEDPGFRRLKWVRYADDLLIGVAGPRSEVEALKEDLGLFLQSLGLRLSGPKTLITSALRGQASFLSHLISVSGSGAGPVKNRKLGSGGTIRAATAPYPAIHGDIPALVRSLAQAGYCRKGLRGVPCRVTRLLHYPEAAIVQHFRVLMMGVGNYYVGATNWTTIRSRLDFILRHSCARTLGSKLRLRTRRKVFQRFGADLAIRDQHGRVVADLPVRLLHRLPVGFRFTAGLESPQARLQRLSRRRERTNRLLAGPCLLCGAAEQIQVHHLRKLSERPSGRHPRHWGPTPEVPFLTEVMRRMNRKQVALCAPCHRQVHRGQYDGPSLRKLAQTGPTPIPLSAEGKKEAQGPKGSLGRAQVVGGGRETEEIK